MECNGSTAVKEVGTARFATRRTDTRIVLASWLLVRQTDARATRLLPVKTLLVGGITHIYPSAHCSEKGGCDKPAPNVSGPALRPVSQSDHARRDTHAGA